MLVIRSPTSVGEPHWSHSVRSARSISGVTSSVCTVPASTSNLGVMSPTALRFDPTHIRILWMPDSGSWQTPCEMCTEILRVPALTQLWTRVPP